MAAAALPPSSSVTCLCGTDFWICQPTGPEPVNDTTGSRSSATSDDAWSFGTLIALTMPTGRSVSATISASTSADSGVFGAGFKTTGAPTAIAGATLWASSVGGKVTGDMQR